MPCRLIVVMISLMRRVASTMVVVLAAACCASAADSTRVVGEWGQPSHGLAARLTADSSSVPMGATVTFGITFRYARAAGKPSLRVLGEFFDVWAPKFVFRDRATGRLFERAPMADDGPMPVPDLEGGAGLATEPIPAIPVTIRLLDESGEQIPPGMYAVTAVYSSGGDVNSKGQKLPAPPGSVPWSGKLRTGELRVRVMAAEPQRVAFELPRWIRVRLDEDVGQLVWDFENPWRTVQVDIRPGYHISSDWRVGCSVHDEQSVSNHGAWRWEDQRTEWGGPPSRSYLPRAPMALRGLTPEKGHPVEVAVIVEVLETAAGYHGSPLRADYRVLVADTLRARWP
ncbi:MAG: hypothetical protein U0167_15295 [bacterium]